MTAIKINTFLVFLSFAFSSHVYGQSPGEYRSRESGDWADVATWETFSDNNWVEATHIPTFTSNVISIVNGHVITVTGNITISQVIINSGGVLMVNSGILNVSDAAGTDIDCNGTFEFNGGTLTGTGSIEINNGSNFTLNGAVIDGDITVNVNAGAIFSMPAADNVLGGSANPVINNYGECIWNNGNLYFNDGSPVINNYGIFNIYTDAEVNSSNTTTGSFNNKPGGIVNRTGSPEGITYFNGAIRFVNEGTMNISSGYVRFLIPFFNRGTLFIEVGAGAYFTKGISVFAPASSVSGEGGLFFDGGTITFNCAAVAVKNVRLSADTLSVAADVHVLPGCNFTIANGVVNGSGDINFSDGSVFTWSDGLITGSGNINISPGAEMNIDGNERTLAKTKIINNYGTANWNKGTIHYYGSKPVINNFGTFNINSDAALTDSNNSAGEFINMPGGLINKMGNTESHTDFSGSFSFTNNGAFIVNSGNIILQVNSYHSGDIIIGAGASLKLNTDTAFMYAGTNISGQGELDCSGSFVLMEDVICNVSVVNITDGTVNYNSTSMVSDGCIYNLSGGILNGQGNVFFSNGSVFNWSGGIIGGNGLMTIGSDALFNMNSGTHYFADSKKLDNYGVWSWENGEILCTGDSIMLNNYGVMFMTTDDSLFLGSTHSVFTNQAEGDIIKEGTDSGFTLINGTGAFNNYGSTSIRSGNLNLAVNGQHSGRYDIYPDGKLSGTIELSFTGSIINNNGYVALATLLLNGTNIQNLDGNGVIESCVISNPEGVVITDAQRITHNLTIASDAKLFVDKELVVQHN